MLHVVHALKNRSHHQAALQHPSHKSYTCRRAQRLLAERAEDAAAALQAALDARAAIRRGDLLRGSKGASGGTAGVGGSLEVRHLAESHSLTDERATCSLAQRIPG